MADAMSQRHFSRRPLYIKICLPLLRGDRVLLITLKIIIIKKKNPEVLLIHTAKVPSGPPFLHKPILQYNTEGAKDKGTRGLLDTCDLLIIILNRTRALSQRGTDLHV